MLTNYTDGKNVTICNSLMKHICYPIFIRVIFLFKQIELTERKHHEVGTTFSLCIKFCLRQMMFYAFDAK